jgi:hypothetical protein
MDFDRVFKAQRYSLNRFIAILLIVFAAAGMANAQEAAPPATGTSAAPALRISSLDDVKAEFDAVPCDNKLRIEAVRALFEKMGAKPDEIVLGKDKKYGNVLISKPGVEAPEEKVVIGAHFDKLGDGCGAIDNWTGIVALAHIYRTIKDLPMRKTIIFAAFGREEQGLVGSSEMAGGIRKEEVPNYCAMINIDSLGLGVPQTLDNVSSKKMIEFSATVAKEMNLPFSRASVSGASSDSASFLRKKIPAVTVHSLNNDWPKILHTRFDKAEKINHENLYQGYRFSAALLLRVVDSECHAFREDKEKKK